MEEKENLEEVIEPEVVDSNTVENLFSSNNMINNFAPGLEKLFNNQNNSNSKEALEAMGKVIERLAEDNDNIKDYIEIVEKAIGVVDDKIKKDNIKLMNY